MLSERAHFFRPYRIEIYFLMHEEKTCACRCTGVSGVLCPFCWGLEHTNSILLVYPNSPSGSWVWHRRGMTCLIWTCQALTKMAKLVASWAGGFLFWLFLLTMFQMMIRKTRNMWGETSNQDQPGDMNTGHRSWRKTKTYWGAWSRVPPAPKAPDSPTR